MDDCEKEAKPPPRYTAEQKLLITICFLCFVGSCLSTFLYLRIESLERRTRTEEAQLRQEINYLKNIIKRPDKPNKTVNIEPDGGTLTNGAIYLFFSH